MRRASQVAMVLALLALGSGCTTAVKQAYYTARGPQGSFTLQEAEPLSSFASYKVATVELMKNDLANIITANMVAACQAETVKELSEAGYFDSVMRAKEEPTAGALVIRGTLVDYKSGNIPGQRAVSGGDYLTAHVHLVDGSSGEVLAKAVVRGEVKSAAHGSEEDFAEGLAKGIGKLIEKVTGREEVEE